MGDRNARRGNYRGRNYGRSYFRGRGQFGGSRWKNTRRADQNDASQPSHDDLILSRRFAERAEVVSHVQSVQAQVVSHDHFNCPYTDWNVYLKNEEYDANGPVIQKVKVIEKYLRKNWALYDRKEIENEANFAINVKDFTADADVLNLWSEVYNDITETPEAVMSHAGLAMHQLVLEEMKINLNEQLKHVQYSAVGTLPETFNLPQLFPRFFNFEPISQIQKIKSNCFKRFVSVKGNVVKVTCIKPLCTKLAFKCFRCQTVQLLTQPYGKYVTPTKCLVRACNSHSFESLRSSPLTETVDWQCIRLQEMKGNDMQQAGSMPRTIRCELTHDLVNSCVPGDEVIVSGVVKVMESDDNAGMYRQRGNKDQCRFLLYIAVNSIDKCKSLRTATNFNPDFTVKELYAIQAIQAEENVFRLLTASLCPSIYGHEMIKAGLVLGLFGGTQKFADDENKIPVRGDPHILVVGDPGLGKSQMLQCCSSVAPRGVYVCGNATTASGLTVTLNREGSGGDYSLEAGALVLSDQGCCCIDEFDKMSSQHSALLEAMEQQCISLAKAGIVCSLPARASILAAANPVGGHYNKAKTVAENLKMGSALLSRFDLVFILLDTPDEEMDSKLAEHIMALNAGKLEKKNGLVTPSQLSVLGTPNSRNVSTSGHNFPEKTLRQHLKYDSNEVCDPIPHQLVRKYISYARKYVHPKISADANRQLQTFYLELRKRLQTADSTPITTRQLESLIRLTEARAKLELREICTEEDANDVIEIMRHSMADVWSDQTGFMDLLRSQHGSGMSGRSQGKKFVAALTRVAERTYNSLFSFQQLRQIAKDIGIQIADFEGFVSSLNNQGFLLKKGPKVYQLLTTDY